MASNDRRSMGLRRLAKMLFTYRMPGFLSESRQPESTRLVPMWPGMRLRLIDSFPGQPCLKGGGDSSAARWVPPSPATRRAVRGKSYIAQHHLVGGESWHWLARVNRRWLVDLCDGLSHEKAVSDEFREAQGGHFHPVDARCDTKEEISNHCRQDLQANGVVVVAEEIPNVEMLLDPAKQQLDLPAGLIERGYLHRGAVHVVGDEGDYTALIALDANAAQRDGQLGISLAGEHDFGIVDDGEAVTDALFHRPTFVRPKPRILLRPRDEAGFGGVDLGPPAVVIVPLVEHVGCARLDRHPPADLDVVDGRRRDLDLAWAIGLGVVDDMHFHAADTSIPLGPATHLAERDRRRVDEAQHLASAVPGHAVGYLRQHGKDVRKNSDRAARVRIRQRRARERADAEMIVMVGIGIEAGFEPPQTRRTAELRVDQNR